MRGEVEGGIIRQRKGCTDNLSHTGAHFERTPPICYSKAADNLEIVEYLKGIEKQKEFSSDSALRGETPHPHTGVSR
jgi:hypothetical protein